MAIRRYEVVPHVGIGPVKLGMSREESRRAMAEPVRTSEHSPERDFFLENSFQVFFDEHDRVEYIEVSAHQPLAAIYKGYDLHRTPAADVVALLERDAPYNRDYWELGYSYEFPELELAVWRPIMPEGPDDPTGRYFATVGVGRPHWSLLRHGRGRPAGLLQPALNRDRGPTVSQPSVAARVNGSAQADDCFT